MPIMEDVVQAQLAGTTVIRARLLLLDFASGAMRLHEGFGKIRTADGHIWYGAGGLGSIGEIESAMGDTAPEVAFTLSGVHPEDDPEPDALARALGDPADYKGRAAKVFHQHLTEDGGLLSVPYATFSGTMDVLKVSRPDHRTRVVTLAAEGRFTQRGFSPFAWISDRIQKRLQPGDRAMEHVASMASKTVNWPSY